MTYFLSKQFRIGEKIMKKYGLRIFVYLSTFVEIEAKDEAEAVKQVEDMYDNGSLMGDFKDNEYYERMETDTEEWSVYGQFGIRVLVLFSTFVEIKSISKEKAIEKAKKMYYSGKLMTDFTINEYYDGMDIDVEY